MLFRLTIGLVFIVVPMLELMLLIKIGQSIGVLATVALVLGTALTGASIVSHQGLAVITRTLQAVSEGRPPVEAVLDGLFLLAAGVLLLTPGLITDAVALALLVPPLRRTVARASIRWVLRRANVKAYTYEGTARSPSDPGDGPVIEGEFERLDEPAGGSRRRGPPGSNA